MRETTCCFSGHRPDKLPWGYDELDPRCRALKQWMREQISAACRGGYRRFLCGMALGCDTYFCETLLELRNVDFPSIIIEAAVPFEGQELKWPSDAQVRYQGLLDACDVITVLQKNFTPDCMARRNRYMIDQSSRLLCVYDGKPGGTMHTLLYALRAGVELIQANPADDFTAPARDCE